MSSRTKGPWFVYRDNPTLICTAKNEIIADTYGLDFDAEDDRANAAFIVRACNSHDQLAAALRRVIAATDSYSTLHAPDEDDVARMIEYAAAFDNARAVLVAVEA